MDFGALFTGMTGRARDIRKEEQDREHQTFMDIMSYGQHILDSPNTPTTMKDEATDMMNNALMSHLHGAQFKPNKNKLYKFIESYVGGDSAAKTQGYTEAASKMMQSQPGVGSGNATHPVVPPVSPQGVLPKAPFDMSGVGAPPTQTPAPENNINATVGLPTGPPAPPPNIAGDMASMAQGGFQEPQPSELTANGFIVDPVKHKIYTDWQAKKQEVEAQRRENQVKWDGPDIESGPKHGEIIDARMAPLYVQMIKATEPKPSVSHVVRPDGTEDVVIVDQNPDSKTFGKILSQTDLGSKMTPVGVGAVTVLINKAEAEKIAKGNGPLTSDEVSQLISEAAAEKTTATVKARNEAEGIDAAAVTAEVNNFFSGNPQWDISKVPVKGGLRNRVQTAISQRVAAGAKPTIQLTERAQSIIQETEPTIQMTRKLKALIEPYKDSNMPLTDAVQRAAYTMGFATDQSGEIASAELLKVVGAARVMKGTSRAYNALEIAMSHLPNVKVDSYKLMWDKLENLEENLVNVKSDAYLYGNKFGFVPPNNEIPQGPPPGAKIIEIGPDGKIKK